MPLFKKYGTGILLGLAVGVFTAVGQKYLPGEWNFLANSGAVWLVPAYLASYYGRLGKGHAIGVCTLCLLGCVCGFYGVQALRSGRAPALGFYPLLWVFCALAGGVVFGLGASLANRGYGFLNCCGRNILPAVFLAEGLNRALHFSEYSHMLPAILVTTAFGAALYACLSGRKALSRENLLSLVLLTGPGLAGYEALFRITA